MCPCINDMVQVGLSTGVQRTTMDYPNNPNILTQVISLINVPHALPGFERYTGITMLSRL